MNRAMMTRIKRLEAQRPARPLCIFHSDEQDDAAFEAWHQALLATGEARQDDLVIRRVFVSPPKWEEIA
jgi:hypothetical protein